MLWVQDTPQEQPTTYPTLFICFFYQPWLCPSYNTRLCADTRDIRHLTEDNTSSFTASLCPQLGRWVLQQGMSFPTSGKRNATPACWMFAPLCAVLLHIQPQVHIPSFPSFNHRQLSISIWHPQPPGPRNNRLTDLSVTTPLSTCLVYYDTYLYLLYIY